MISKSSFYHGPVVILMCRIFVAQNGVTVAPILPFKTNGSRLKIYAAHMLGKWCIWCAKTFL